MARRRRTCARTPDIVFSEARTDGTCSKLFEFATGILVQVHLRDCSLIVRTSCVVDARKAEAHTVHVMCAPCPHCLECDRPIAVIAACVQAALCAKMSPLLEQTRLSARLVH